MTLPPKVTDGAFKRLHEINANEEAPKPLRIAVDGGGCSGFQYRIELVDGPESEDLILEKDGQKVLIDPVSLPFLENAVIDFTRELIGSRFEIKNPNATSSCGCGTSFAI